jgi:hypothetical protein
MSSGGMAVGFSAGVGFDGEITVEQAYGAGFGGYLGGVAEAAGLEGSDVMAVRAGLVDTGGEVFHCSVAQLAGVGGAVLNVVVFLVQGPHHNGNALPVDGKGDAGEVLLIGLAEGAHGTGSVGGEMVASRAARA